MGITKEQFRDAITQIKNFIVSKVSGISSELNSKVPTSRTINGKALSEDITLKASDIGADASGTAANQITSHNIHTSAHNDIRLLITGLTDRLNALADSDDTTLDQMKEVVAYIKANRELIESITTAKINVDDIINDLTTNVVNKPLSAAQGVVLKGLIDALQSQVNNLATHVENDDVHVTTEQKENWDAAFETKHGHANWSILNGITQTLIDTWNTVTGKADKDHTHTKADIGLSNVDNTADTDKPVSTAQQAALDNKADYETGTFTCNVGTLVNGYTFTTLSTITGNYVKIGNKVTLHVSTSWQQAWVDANASNTIAFDLMSNAPFAVSNTFSSIGVIYYVTGGPPSGSYANLSFKHMGGAPYRYLQFTKGSSQSNLPMQITCEYFTNS